MVPPWKAPVPYETLAGAFATRGEATKAGATALAPIADSELADLFPYLQSRSQHAGDQCVPEIAVPEKAIHGYLIYDETGTEVFNWTTLDVAVERAAGS